MVSGYGENILILKKIEKAMRDGHRSTMKSFDQMINSV